MTQKSITIQGVEFTIATPYVAGHPITEAEAKALNQVRAENIRNNCAGLVKTAKGEGEEVPAEAMEKLLADVAAYDAAYVFSLASVGGGRKSVDPVESEARRLAKTAIAAKLAAAGRTLKSVDKDALDAAIAKLAESESIQKEAKRIVKARKESVSADLADLGI